MSISSSDGIRRWCFQRTEEKIQSDRKTGAKRRRNESYEEARRLKRKRDAEIWADIRREMDETGEEMMEDVNIDPLNNRRREWNRLYHARRRAKIRAYKKKEGSYVAPNRSRLADLIDTVGEKKETKPKYKFNSEYCSKLKTFTLLCRLKDRNIQLEKELAEERRRAEEALRCLEYIESQLRATI